jgi:hypothetical protein
MKSKPRSQVEKWGFVFFALTEIQPLTFARTRDRGFCKAKSESRNLDAG